MVQGSPTKVVIAKGTETMQDCFTTDKVTTRRIPIRIWDKDERGDGTVDKLKGWTSLISGSLIIKQKGYEKIIKHKL